MDEDGREHQQDERSRIYYEFIAANILADEIDGVADVQRSALPAITLSLKNLPFMSFPGPLRNAVSKNPNEHVKDRGSVEVTYSGREDNFASVLRFSVTLNRKLAYRDFDKVHINYSRPSGALGEEEPPRKTSPLLSDTAKVAALRYANNQKFSPLLADVVRAIQDERHPSTTAAKKVPEDQWRIVAEEINQLTEEAGVKKEDIDSFLQTNPELQDEVDELIKVLDFADPVQRALIINTMKALTYLMFFAVIIGSWHVVAAYASLISLMGVTAPNVVKAVGNGTEKLLNKISPLEEEGAKD